MSRLVNWFKFKLCGDELTELANLKRNINDMKHWCSHIPVARDCGEWLENPKSYPSQSVGAHGSIEDFRAYLKKKSLRLNSRESYNIGVRASGRTFRTVLGAALQCSELPLNDRQTVLLVGHDGNMCRYLMHLLLSITSSVSGCIKDSSDSVIFPNGSRILIVAADSLNRRPELMSDYHRRNELIFFDHYTSKRD